MTDQDTCAAALLAEFVETVWRRLDEGAPAGADAAARRLLLDCTACAVSGFSKPEPAALAASLAAGGTGSRAPLGAPAALAPQDAALAAGAAVCWDEACEGLARAHGRPGIHAFAALTGALCRTDAQLARVLEAFVAGYEVGGRAGALLRVRPGMHVDGTWGLFAASAAVSRFEGHTAALATDRLAAVACQIPASLFAPVAHGDTVRNLYVGNAAALALTVEAGLAAGFTAPRAALEAVDDYLFTVDLDGLAGAGTWLIEDAYIKPFAAVRHAHYPAAAAIALARRLAGRHAEVQEIVISTYAEALTYAGNRAPQTPIAAQFSLSWAVAHALVSGDLGPDASRPEALSDPLARALEARVRLEADETRFPTGTRGARVAIVLGDERLSVEIDTVRGDPGQGWTDADIAEKARRYLAPLAVDARIARVVDAVLFGPVHVSAADIFCPRA